MAKIIASDIGGTSARFAAFEGQSVNNFSIKDKVWLKTSEVSSFSELIEQLDKSSFSLKIHEADYVVFSIAGPIEKGVLCTPPNIKWKIDLSFAERDFGIKRFSLINDFLAQAFGCLTSPGESAEIILQGKNNSGHQTKAVIGAGTGLGKAILVPDQNGNYIGVPSEGGHGNFSAQTETEFLFQQFVSKRISVKYPSWDDIVSGRGLSTIHAFLSGEELEPRNVASVFDKWPETLAWYARFYGRVARNFSLDTLCLGGLYLAGGVAAKNPVIVKHPEFRAEFVNSRIHKKLLEEIPVKLVNDEDSGLWGAAYCGFQKI